MKATRSLALLLVLLTGCSSDPVSPFQVRDGVRTVLVDFGGSVLHWPDDPVTITAFSTDGDTLLLTVQYSGGCREHDFALIAWNGWLETVPVAAGLLLAHDANGDACEALITETLRFDLSPLRRSHELHYRSPHGTVRLRFEDPRGPRQPPLVPPSLLWEF